MQKLALAILLIAALVGFVSQPGERTPTAATPQAPAVEAAGVQASPHQAGNGYASTVLDRAGDGHFYAEMQVNGMPVRFMVDTGASKVALTREDAQRIGLQFSNEEFTGQARTASGTVGIKPVTLDRVALGPLEATAVEGAIIDQGLPISLLGQSWLRLVGTVTIEGDKMVLR